MTTFLSKNAGPATRWNDATPTGNGRLGAMMYGKLADERILLNHERFWYHGVNQPLPCVAEHLPEMRRMMLAGDYATAEKFLSEKVREQGYATAVSSYMPGFDLRIYQEVAGAFRDYSRVLDMATGEVRVDWKVADVSFSRRLFTSRVHKDVAVVKLSAHRPGQLSCRLALEPHDLKDACRYSGMRFEVDNTYRYAAEGNALITCGETADGSAFCAAARVTTVGGTTALDGTHLTVSHADSVLIRIAVLPCGDTEAALKAADACGDDYDTLLEEHSALHRPLFMRSVLALTDENDPEREKSNEQLLLDAYSGRPANALVERMYHFSRFLMLCSSVGGDLPAGLQGIWNGDYEPPWCATFFYNENVQLSYWQTLPCNEAEALLPLFTLLEKQMEDFRENARQIYGCRGIFVPLYGDAESGRLRDLQPQVIYWTAGAGWLAQHFYDYFLYTGDRAFLKDRAIPFMKEAALFYEDFFLTGEDGYQLSVPGDSPENWANGDFDGAGRTAVCINPTIDFAVAKELLTNLCRAHALLGIEDAKIAVWQEMLSKIPPYQVNEDGALREWMHPDFRDNYHHRHQSHIYPAFPSTEITKETDPRLYDACRKAVEKRLVIGLGAQTGWSFSHMANIFGRLGEGERALECLEYLLRSCTGCNLFTYINDWRDMGISDNMIWGVKPPMQLDAAFGYAGGVAEMLLFSTADHVRVLPALPAAWKTGRFEHYRTRNRLDISCKWDGDKGVVDVSFIPDEDVDFTLELPCGYVLTDTAAIPCDRSDRYYRISAKSGTAYHLRAVNKG